MPSIITKSITATEPYLNDSLKEGKLITGNTFGHWLSIFTRTPFIMAFANIRSITDGHHILPAFH
jgi:hypothetical protein